MTNLIQSVQLFCKKDGSNKEYHLRLVSADQGFLVEYSNGPRGGTLKTGLRTKSPVTREEATALYESVLKSKLKDGYTEDGSGVAYVGTDKADQKTAFEPQLLTPIEQDEALRLIKSGLYRVQTKFDGERRYAAMMGAEAVFANRNGLRVPAKETFVEALQFIQLQCAGDFELDCEDMGSHLVVFDVLRYKGQDLRQAGFFRRFTMAKFLQDAVKGTEHAKTIRFAELLEGVTAETLQQLRQAKAEGICLKLGDAPYEPGRKRTQCKLKFWEEATVRVRSQHPIKRSVEMEMVDPAGNWIAVGNVTIPVNVAEIPAVGSLMDVVYLYGYEGGALFEPSFSKIRTDLTDDSASTAQIKLKETYEIAA